MMKILLLCSFGISVDVLKKRMMKEIHAQGLAYEIIVSALSEASVAGKEADIILLTPQVRFNLAKVKHLFPEKQITCITKDDFISGNGKAVIDIVKSFYGNQENACKKDRQA